MSKLSKKEARIRRHRRLRHRISGTAEVPRMSVCRTAKHLYVQLVDDEAATTLVSGSTLEGAFKETGLGANAEGAAALGKIVAEKAIAAKIEKVVFDRGGFRYHGRIKALADAAREAGLKF
jgi:large subunit ribosomal protein L18